MLADIVRDDVVVPVDVPFRYDALRQVGHRDIRIAAHAAVGDDAIIPVIAALNAVVHEGIGRRDRKQIADAGIVVDRERFPGELVAIHLEVPAAASEVVFPRFAREQHADTTIRIHTEDRDIGVLIETEIQPDPLTAGINGRITAVGPQLDTRAVQTRIPGCGCGHERQAEQR